MSDLRQKWRERRQAPPALPLEATREFLLSYCADAESMAEIEASVARMVAIGHPHTLIAGLAGMEGVLAQPPAPDVLANLVAWEVNWVLDDPSDEGAKAWLRALIALVRKHLGEQAPPPDETD